MLTSLFSLFTSLVSVTGSYTEDGGEYFDSHFFGLSLKYKAISMLQSQNVLINITDLTMLIGTLVRAKQK